MRIWQRGTTVLMKSPDEDDRVGKGYWKGHGGADRDP